ncbi:uncharacterized protein LOC133190622 [Saccostrea echinata]|uniref:uncharacterized protein LOC133190622 n=1 Tax=Saccostrea echinata TaxID=191078 RepID=UPI002A829D6A|nr:uncharacterized protein LOC133190622 [Saccostrea echinata]
MKPFPLITFLLLPLMGVTKVSDQSFALCGDQKGFIRCANGTKIQIVSANYGRTDQHVCPGNNTNTNTCRSKTSEIKVKWNCNGYRMCHLHASNKIFGDECPNYSKYLEITYRCVQESKALSEGKSFIAFHACTHRTLHFHRNTPTNIVYDGAYFNNGSAYDTHSGFFTAPSDGLYTFAWSSLVGGRKIFNSEICVNSYRKGLLGCNNEDNPGLQSCSNTVPLILKSGDRVNIRSITGNNLLPFYSSFQGWKI